MAITMERETSQGSCEEDKGKFVGREGRSVTIHSPVLMPCKSERWRLAPLFIGIYAWKLYFRRQSGGGGLTDTWLRSHF